MDELASLREFCLKVASHVYAFVVGVIGGVLGLVSGLYAEARPKAAPLIPLWLWLPLLAAGFLVAILRAFHDVRTERDAAKDEIERRFSALRYALRRSSIDYHLDLQPNGTWNVQVGLNLANDSDEYLRYEVEHIVVFIEARSAQTPQFHNRGVIIAPHATDLFRYPFINGIPANWQTGSIEFTVKYGHPSTPPRYWKTQELKLRTSRVLGQPPGRDLRIDADLIHDSEVEDI